MDISALINSLLKAVSCMARDMGSGGKGILKSIATIRDILNEIEIIYSVGANDGSQETI